MMVLRTQVNKMYVIATLSVYPHRASLKNMPGHGGIRTYDLCNASPMLCQLSYAVRSVRVCDISKLTPVPQVSVCNMSVVYHLPFCSVLYPTQQPVFHSCLSLRLRFLPCRSSICSSLGRSIHFVLLLILHCTMDLKIDKSCLVQ